MSDYDIFYVTRGTTYGKIGHDGGTGVLPFHQRSAPPFV
jgi:hypothetical protein